MSGFLEPFLQTLGFSVFETAWCMLYIRQTFFSFLPRKKKGTHYVRVNMVSTLLVTILNGYLTTLW